MNTTPKRKTQRSGARRCRTRGRNLLSKFRRCKKSRTPRRSRLPAKSLIPVVEGPRKSEPARSSTESGNSGNAQAIAARQVQKTEGLQAVNSAKSGSQSGMNDRKEHRDDARNQYLECLKDTLKVA